MDDPVLGQLFATMEAQVARWLGVGMLAAFCVGALAGCMQQQAAAPAPPAPATPAPLTSDQNFIDRAALGTGTEVELGRLARTRAASPAVRAFADRIIADHRQAHARLTRIEHSMQMSAMRVAPPANQLASLAGPQFDRAFMADQIKNHQEAIQLFQTEAQIGQDPRLRKYASDTLPMLYRNLRDAQAIAARLGG
jgi:putative membrane protein